MVSRSTAVAFLSAVVMSGCDSDPSSPPFGNMDLTTSAPAVANPISTVDGWTVKYDHFLVHVSSVDVASADGVVAASEGDKILDQVAPGTKSLLSATLRTARAWEAVSLQIGPAAPDTDVTIIGAVAEEDRTAMQTEGLSVLVVGQMSKAGVVKNFRWGFTTDTVFGQCADDRGGQSVPGLIVPPNGGDAADFLMAGEALFSDSLAAGGTLRADAIAAADIDNDGAISLDELRSMSLRNAQTFFQGAYAGEEGIANLGAFIEARVSRLVTRFRSAGTCTAEPVVADEE